MTDERNGLNTETMAWERWAVTSLDWAGRISPGPLALQNLHQAKSLSQESLS